MIAYIQEGGEGLETAIKGMFLFLIVFIAPLMNLVCNIHIWLKFLDIPVPTWLTNATATVWSRMSKKYHNLCLTDPDYQAKIMQKFCVPLTSVQLEFSTAYTQLAIIVRTQDTNDNSNLLKVSELKHTKKSP